MKPDVASTHDRVGPYQLVKAIGAGGSARIDLARIDRAYGFQRHVVIKRPLEHLRSDAKAAASLRREAAIGARLRHPNLVAILDAGVHDGYDYLVLEYVHGGALRTLMQADAPARVRDCATNVAVAIVGDVARALHEAHELTDASGHPLGLVHRDVSPGNILLGLDGSVKLADFGIAKETRVQTLSGSMHGTVTYMAPEQCRGHAFDRRADVFSLGVILYELVTGTRLFWADNDVASLHRVLSGTVPRPRKLRPTISTTLEEIVMAAVAHDQDKRLATARELADALEIYAAEAGEILGARWTARWVHEILGPREVPWIAAAAPVVAEDDGSLVELIAPLEDEPVDPTFGPSFSDEIDTEPQRARPTKSNKKLAVFIAAGLVAGAGATAFVMTRGDAPTPATVVEPPAKIEMAVEPPTVAPIEKVKAEASPEAPEAINITPTPTRTRVVKRKKPPVKESTTTAPPAKPPPAKPPPAKAIDENAPAVVVEPKPAGSGSARSTTKAEWNPTMLLPTDSGSGTKKQ